MSEQAIRKIKNRFIRISMISLIITMFFIAGLMYIGNNILNRQSINIVLDYISENNGYLVDWDEDSSEYDSSSDFFQRIFYIDSGIRSEEFQYETRYFVIFYDADENVDNLITTHIEALSENEVLELGSKALERNKTYGQFDGYYYKLTTNEDGTSMIVYLDASNYSVSNNRLLYLSFIFIGFGMIIAFIIVRVLSKKAIQGEIKNAELQKQFITNISHELKTPLAVIRGNTEMDEMLRGESEWTQSTLRQVERMDGLIKNLVLITRAEERQTHEDAHNVDITKAVTETAENFRSLALQNNKALTLNVDENVTMICEESQIRQLCSLLVDNAIKYCDDGGEITVSLNQRGKGVTLSVSNNYDAGKDVDYSRFFERFYREDESHSVDKGGYGIGLSIAESLVKQYHGSISATWKNGTISFICLLKSL